MDDSGAESPPFPSAGGRAFEQTAADRKFRHWRKSQGYLGELQATTDTTLAEWSEMSQYGATMTDIIAEQEEQYSKFRARKL